jgi:hypothetical protein
MMDLASIRINARPLQHIHSVDVYVRRAVDPKIRGHVPSGSHCAGLSCPKKFSKKRGLLLDEATGKKYISIPSIIMLTWEAYCVYYGSSS